MKKISARISIALQDLTRDTQYAPTARGGSNCQLLAAVRAGSVARSDAVSAPQESCTTRRTGSANEKRKNKHLCTAFHSTCNPISPIRCAMKLRMLQKHDNQNAARTRQESTIEFYTKNATATIQNAIEIRGFARVV